MPDKELEKEVDVHMKSSNKRTDAEFICGFPQMEVPEIIPKLEKFSIEETWGTPMTKPKPPSEARIQDNVTLQKIHRLDNNWAHDVRLHFEKTVA